MAIPAREDGRFSKFAREQVDNEDLTTLAVMPMADLGGPTGVLAVLRERGYTVIEPNIEEEYLDHDVD